MSIIQLKTTMDSMIIFWVLYKLNRKIILKVCKDLLNSKQYLLWVKSNVNWLIVTILYSLSNQSIVFIALRYYHNLKVNYVVDNCME